MTVRKRFRHDMVLTLAVFCFGGKVPARADFLYAFNVDTSSASGQTGSLDIQFNGFGPGDTDTAAITSFSSVGGTLGIGTLTGDVTGSLASLPATFTDDTSFNDLSHIFTFGSSLQFTVDLTTINTSPGATFAFTMYDDSGNPVDAIVNNFDAVEIDVDSDGNPESPQMGVGASGGLVGGPVVTPEPASAILLALGGFCMVAYLRWRGSASGNERLMRIAMANSHAARQKPTTYRSAD
jgi:hypothetical protein